MSSQHAQALRKMAREMLDLADAIDGVGPGRSSAAPSRGNGSRDTGPVTVNIDDARGNPNVRKDPKRGWDGPSYVGTPYSDCPPDYLDALAGYLEWCAEKDAEKGTADGDKYARYGRLDAARARAWAQRIRSQQSAPKSNGRDEGDDDFDSDDSAPIGGGGSSDDDIPFARFE